MPPGRPPLLRWGWRGRIAQDGPWTDNTDRTGTQRLPHHHTATLGGGGRLLLQYDRMWPAQILPERWICSPGFLARVSVRSCPTFLTIGNWPSRCNVLLQEKSRRDRISAVRSCGMAHGKKLFLPRFHHYPQTLV